MYIWKEWTNHFRVWPLKIKGMVALSKCTAEGSLGPSQKDLMAYQSHVKVWGGLFRQRCSWAGEQCQGRIRDIIKERILGAAGKFSWIEKNM